MTVTTARFTKDQWPVKMRARQKRGAGVDAPYPRARNQCPISPLPLLELGVKGNT